MQRLVSKQQIGTHLLTYQASGIGLLQSALDTSDISRLTALSFTTLTDIKDIETCEQQWSTFSSIVDLSVSKHFTSSISTTTQIFEVWEGVGEGEIYTTCDDIPRFRFSSSPSLTITKLVSQIGTSLNWQPDSELQSYQMTYSYPHCQADKEYCMKKEDALRMELIDRHDKDLRGSYVNAGTICLYVNNVCYMKYDDEVLVLYWPSKTQSRDMCTLRDNIFTVQPDANVNNPGITTVVTSAITFEGQDRYLIASHGGDEYGWRNSTSINYIMPSTLTGPFTFTYPTVYLAHRPITRVDILGSNSLNRTHRTAEVRPAGIIPLKSGDIYTAAWNTLNTVSGVKYAQQVAAGHFEPQNPFYKKKTFMAIDFRDFQDHVPASVYYDARSEDCWGTQSHCGTITDGSYRPTVIIKNRGWFSAMPKHFSCGMGELNDPPRALTTIGGADPTLGPAIISRFPTAQPGGQVTPLQSSQTPLAYLDDILPKPTPSNQDNLKSKGATTAASHDRLSMTEFGQSVSGAQYRGNSNGLSNVLVSHLWSILVLPAAQLALQLLY